MHETTIEFAGRTLAAQFRDRTPVDAAFLKDVCEMLAAASATSPVADESEAGLSHDIRRVVITERAIMEDEPRSPRDFLLQAIVICDRLHRQEFGSPADVIAVREAAAKLVELLEVAAGTTRRKMGLSVYCVSPIERAAAELLRLKVIEGVDGEIAH